jgi:uncharacterized protein (DUF305 family)
MNCTRLYILRGAVTALFLLSTAVYADDQRAGGGAHGSTELHATMMKGMDAGHAMKMTGDVDKDFAAMMAQHHQQAIDMIDTYQKHGKNAELKAMASKMADQQKMEIGELKRYR